MTGMERKYMSEAGLNVFASIGTIVRIENLQNLIENDKHQYHIYGIMTYNQMYFRRDKICGSEDGYRFNLFTVDNNQETDYYVFCSLTIGNDRLDHTKVVFNCDYPFTSLKYEIKDESFLLLHPEFVNKEKVIYAQELFDSDADELVNKIEYEVLYIGQSYGFDGHRTAFGRLRNHQTLQQIQIDISTKCPNKHIYIILFEFGYNITMLLDGTRDKYTMSDEADDQHINDIFTDLPEEAQVINITEAALINYFKPDYNVNFVDNFPDERHQGYRQYYRLDYNMLIVELGVEFNDSVPVCLRTNTSAFKFCFDQIEYKLYNDSNRLSILDIFDK